MQKQKFNTAWLNRIVLNGNLVHLCFMQKYDDTAVCKLCHEDMNVEHLEILSNKTT